MGAVNSGSGGLHYGEMGTGDVNQQCGGSSTGGTSSATSSSSGGGDMLGMLGDLPVLQLQNLHGIPVTIPRLPHIYMGHGPAVDPQRHLFLAIL